MDIGTFHLNRRFVLRLLIITGIAMLHDLALGQHGIGSLFSDIRARSVGDVITILIMEESSAASTANTKTDKEHQLTIDGGGGSIPDFGISGGTRNKFNGIASTSRTGQLRAKMTARITEVLENGNYVLEGTRAVKMNNETESTVIKGIIRARDITTANTVFSYDIADVEITHNGRGTISRGKRPGLFARLFNLLF